MIDPTGRGGLSKHYRKVKKCELERYHRERPDEAVFGQHKSWLGGQHAKAAV